MACEPLILSPCADDNVSVANALGAQSDVNFQEYGQTPLTAGQTEREVTFDYQKESALYVFEYLYVKSADDSPDNITAVPTSQAQRKFKVKLSGAPTDANSVLIWRVTIPDPLRVICVGNGPCYAIIREEQHGSIALVQDQDFIIVAFPETMPDNDWGFEQLSFQRADADPIEFPVMGFVPIVTSHTMTGFTLVFQGSPDANDYTMHWQVR